MAEAHHAKLVVITGAAQGVGWATYLHLREQGYRVMGWDKEPMRGIPGDSTLCEQIDITDSQQVRDGLARLVATHGIPDVWINNAGVGTWGPFEEGAWGSERAEMEVNYFGAVNCIRGILSHWKAQGYGHLIQVTSSTALFYPPRMATYAASKAAIRAFIHGLRGELQGTGIRVSEIVPNTITTAMSGGANRQYIPRAGSLSPELTPERVAAAMARLIERPTDEVHLPGLITPFHILNAIAPGLVAWMMRWPRRPTSSR